MSSPQERQRNFDEDGRAGEAAAVPAQAVFAGLQVLLLASVAAMLLFGTARGCYVVDQPSPTELSVRYAAWVAGAVLGVAGAIGLLGLWLLATPGRRKAGFVALGIALFAGGIIVPGVTMDRFEVTPDRVRQRTGFWFYPNVKGFEITQPFPPTVVIGEKYRRGTRWTVYGPDGGVDQVDPGTLWENNEALAVEAVKANGVVVGRE